ncbi:disintegrin and metalloproteinase domain-containing protein 1a-like [Choloepus didactylus]|uniref:disintegrin and metalloproteinase domain-containing protein 1a-like n=1 Tax=Choloepus didactylus TaxID=27675 RepID=UPI0018A0CEC2|nr:disintegrin and metalloproteinase domain-containing protein 1a-like [Choloepus didactylus]
MLMAALLRDAVSILLSLQKNQVPLEEGKKKFQTWATKKRDLSLGLVPEPSSARMSIMLLVVVIFLPSMYCDLASDYYSFYEIIIPKRLTVEGRDDPVDKASYALFMQGQRQVIHLKVKKDYFVSNFPVYSYHNGILRQEMPFISHDCHYEGYIEGVPGSFVSVNTCSGLKGILIKEEKYYSVEPMNSSRRFEHVLYTTAQQAQVSCSITSEESQGVSSNLQQGSKKPGKAQTLSYLWSHTKYVEMFVVVNSQRFQMWGSNINETIQGVMDIIALANSFTRAINTEVVLVGMEIWTEGDLTEVTVDLEAALSNFNSWRQKKFLNRVKYDVAHMIVGHHPRENMGQAFLGGACSSGFAAAVESFHHKDVLLFAALMVHELGHNLGIQHDHLACICKDKHFCLMHQNITKESFFSNCSSDYFYQFLHEHKGACLFNKPRHTGRKRRAANCGDGVVEETEECDCGAACGNHPCCDTTCKLKKEAECSQELCCTMCKLSKKGHLCRPALDECDLPEYCNGTSKQCPADSYLQDGTNCEGNYYCVGGRCRSPDEQCKELFGPEATSAPQDCYTSFNQKGDRFGNCGRSSTNGGTYVRCRDDNKLCGKLVCSGVRILPEIKLQHTLIQVSRETDECWSMDASGSPDNPKDGDVTFGTYCAPQKICTNYSCTDDIMLNYDCKPAEMCNGKGVCNNLKHCHCEAGFAPPDCKKEGDGGSVDSGTPGKQTEDKQTQEGDKNKPKENEEAIARSLLALFLLFIIALLILCITCAVFQGKPAAKPAEAPPVIPGEAVPEEAAAPEGPEEELVEEGEEEEEEELE